MQKSPLLKLKAHTLLSALIISIIISIIITSLLLLHYHNNFQWIKYNTNNRIQRNLESAINLVLGDSTHFNIIGEERLDLFNEEADSVTIKKEYWGAYNWVIVTSFYRNQSESKQFFYGVKLEDTLNGSLYLVDHQRQLQISGETELVGDVYLPNGRIKAANIDGKVYENTKLVYGEIHKSDTVLPAINISLLNSLYLNLRITKSKAFQNLNSSTLPDSISNSFKNETQYFYINNASKLSGKTIKGKVVLFSDNLIEINASMYLEDVLIIAPEISIANGFKGSVQLIANKAIKIAEGCELTYPSSILLLKDSISNYQGNIEIGKKSSVSGVVFANSWRKDSYKNLVDLKNGSFCEGIIFVNGYLQLGGMVHGTVLTDYFLYKSIVSTYENSLVDAVIDRTSLSPFFISSTLIKLPGQQNIIKWLK